MAEGETEKGTRLGALALERGILTEIELEQLVSKGGKGTKLGESLVRERFLSAALLVDLLYEQQRRRSGEIRIPDDPDAPARKEKLEVWLARARAKRAQGLLLLAEQSPAIRTTAGLVPLDAPPLPAEAVLELALEAFTREEVQAAVTGKPAAKSIDAPPGRFRAHLAASAQGLSVSFRPLGLDPTTDAHAAPPEVLELARARRGLILVTGGARFDRRSVVAQLVERVCEERGAHVITLEREPEFEHRSRRALVVQREVERHTRRFASAVRSAVREGPDVIAVDEVTDPEAVEALASAAETSLLAVISVHASDAAHALGRLVDLQRPERRGAVAATIAGALRAVAVLDAVVGKDGRRHLVAEIAPGGAQLAKLIVEDALHRLGTGVRTLDGSISKDVQIRRLYEDGLVSRLAVLERATDAGWLDAATPRPGRSP